MNTARLKRFATEARTKIKQGVTLMIRQWGFDADGNAIEEAQLLGGGTKFRDQVFDGEETYYRWDALRQKIQSVGLRNVYEEAAYTWFNRFVAIKILSKNNLLEPYLDYVDGEGKPTLEIIAQARRGMLPEMNESSRRRVMDILDDHNREAELLTILITAVCHNTPILSNCFGKINDYTELLLPRTVTTQGDFSDMLNDDNYITEEDYRQPELIGWLYQFYISERKDEVFASFKSGKKASKDEIPAATQIFTPNWIVKYMVQNTVGRIYLDNNPYSQLKENWKYLVEPSEENTSEDNILKIENPEELTVIDAGCGSGHILVEAFDTLYNIYLEQYASPREACDSILQYNVVGVDIDTRAKQLAQFALLMKACSYVPEMADCHQMPRVFDMPEPLSEAEFNNLGNTLNDFFAGANTKVINETIEALELLQQAQELGSIMKFNVSDSTRYAIKTALENATEDQFAFYKHLKLMLTLTDKYATAVMNPPYMSAGNMNANLSSYIRSNYEEGKADMMTVFMMIAKELSKQKGLWAMINLPSWMFLPSFEDLRKMLLRTQSICSLIYNGRGVFGSDFGSVAFVIKNQTDTIQGIYRKLFEVQGSVRANDEIEQLFLTDNFGKYKFNQTDFLKVPGFALAFWLPMNVLNAFTNTISKIGTAKKGLSTGDNNRFLRLWSEVSFNKLITNATNFDNSYKWYPINKGGIYRKWYGNNEYVINWENNGQEIKEYSGSVIRNPQYYLRESITWTMLSASCFGVRFSPKGKLFEGAGPSLFLECNHYYTLAFLCSKLGNNILRALNPTINININDILNLPIIIHETNKSHITALSEDNMSISKHDWDAHEVSWDFQRSELLSIDEQTYIDNINWQVDKHFRETGEQICIDPAAPQFDSLEWRVDQYKQKWERMFYQLHENEEELNRQFIEIYGLQDELTPEVPLDEITILQQGEIKIEDNEIKWNDDVLMKQFISYSIGVWMGRYRLDKPGLHIAHPAPTEEEIAAYTYNDANIDIDDDGIIPILPEDSPFTDNARNRIVDFISTVFGREKQVENLNFIESALGKSVADYMTKDFWKDHKKMYQNRPIYWLFSSKKGAFQCITYMHRMDEYTLERIRQKYLLPYISFLDDKISAMQARDTLTTAESRQMAKLQTMLDECREYHDRLHQYSQKNIAFDLDDGVVKNYALFGDIVAKLK